MGKFVEISIEQFFTFLSTHQLVPDFTASHLGAHMINGNCIKMGSAKQLNCKVLLQKDHHNQTPKQEAVGALKTPYLQSRWC